MKTDIKIKVTEGDILELLRQRHSEDLFIPKCKTGATWGVKQYYVMDAWSMKRSWSKNITTAYEIKVSRGDFLNDTKHNEYLKYCNQFYFVAPTGIINKNELPPEKGLIETSKNCKTLYTKKKATYRDIEVPKKLLYYILICRADIREEQGIDRLYYWRLLISQNEEDVELGKKVSKKIRDVVNYHIAENGRLKREIGLFKDIEKFLLDEFGIDKTKLKQKGLWGIRKEIQEAKNPDLKIKMIAADVKEQATYITKAIENLVRIIHGN